LEIIILYITRSTKGESVYHMLTGEREVLDRWKCSNVGHNLFPCCWPANPQSVDICRVFRPIVSLLTFAVFSDQLFLIFTFV